MISLIIPSYTPGANLQRTIDSCKGLCDEMIIISTALYQDDADAFQKQADKVVFLPWNFTFVHGFGHMMNEGTSCAKNDWLLLLGTAETVAEHYFDIPARLLSAAKNTMFRMDHHNDPNKWKRLWNRTGGTRWSGLIHEEITGGVEGDVLFRMQDTEKTPMADALRQEEIRFVKTCSYNHLYRRLLHHPEELGGTNEGWIGFVNGAKESIEDFCAKHKDMLDCCLSGDLEGFRKLVSERYNTGVAAKGVNFNPTGEQMTQ